MEYQNKGLCTMAHKFLKCIPTPPSLAFDAATLCSAAMNPQLGREFGENLEIVDWWYLGGACAPRPDGACTVRGDRACAVSARAACGPGLRHD